MSYCVGSDYGTGLRLKPRWRVIADHTTIPMHIDVTTTALGWGGQTNEARTVLDKAITIAPDVFRRYVEQRVPWMGQAIYGAC